jgi:hypothetical protein
VTAIRSRIFLLLFFLVFPVKVVAPTPQATRRLQAVR